MTWRSAAVPLLSFAIACGGAEPVERPASAAPPVASQPLDDSFARVAAIEPAFAGLYLEANRLVVRLTALDRLDSALRAVALVYGPDRFAAYEPAAGLPAAYGWLTLLRWEVALRGVFQFRTVHALDVDERANGIAIAIRDGSEEAAILGFVADAGVPLDAVGVEVRGPDVPL